MTLTPQSVFDTVAVALLAQKVPSQNPISGMCMYRGPRNTKCAVGHLIPDDCAAIREQFGGSVDMLFAEYPGDLPELEAFHEANLYFLDRLQRAHDKPGLIFHRLGEDHIALPEPPDFALTGDWLTDWANDMRVIAQHHGLDHSILD